MADCDTSQLILVVSNLMEALRKKIVNEILMRSGSELPVNYQLNGTCECLLQFKKLMSLFGTWFSRHGGVRVVVGLDDLGRSFPTLMIL